MNTKSPAFLIGAVVVILIVVFGGWQLMKGNEATAPTSTEEMSTSPTPEAAMSDEIKVTLTEQNASGENGTATITEENGYAVVTIDVTGFQPNAQPAHIHIGACPTPGEVKYPLTDVVDGKSVTTLTVPLSQVKSELPLAVNLHKSTDEISVYTSCGNL